MKILIAYYSWKGHTADVAGELARKLNAPIIRIEPLKDSGPVIGGVRALLGLRAPIKPATTDLKDIDHLVIATPVWSHKIPPYTREYLAGITNCRGKRFSVLAEMGGSGAENTIAIVRKILEGKGMTFVASAWTIEKDVNARQFGPTLDTFAGKILAG
jgi:flavodoxin